MSASERLELVREQEKQPVGPVWRGLDTQLRSPFLRGCRCPGVSCFVAAEGEHFKCLFLIGFPGGMRKPLSKRTVISPVNMVFSNIYASYLFCLLYCLKFFQTNVK